MTMRQLAPEDMQVQRDLGICLVHAGKPGKAVDLLTAYLEAHPETSSSTKVKVATVRSSIMGRRPNVAGERGRARW